jgi:hypothetical protein
MSFSNFVDPPIIIVSLDVTNLEYARCGFLHPNPWLEAWMGRCDRLRMA